MKIAVVGAGAMGMLLTARLIAAGCARDQIYLLTRTKHQRSLIARDGLYIETLQGEQSTTYPQAHTVEEASQSEVVFDWVIWAVKQQHIRPQLLDACLRLSDQDTRMLCIQNGLGHLEKLQAHFPQHMIYQAVTTEGALKLDERGVRHTGSGMLWLPDEADNCLHQLKNILTRAGFDIIMSKNIKSAIWNKWVINAIVNPLTTIWRVSNGQLLESEHRLEAMRRLYVEAVELSQAAEVTLAEDLWEQVIGVCRRTALNRSSMLQDMEAGRTTEIEAINGHMIRMAEERGLALPSHKMIYLMIKAIEVGG